MHQWLQTSSPAPYPAWSDGVEGSLCAASGRAPIFRSALADFSGLRPRDFYATSSDLVAINNVLRSRTKWSWLWIPQE
jgi:hypothetical protein